LLTSPSRRANAASAKSGTRPTREPRRPRRTAGSPGEAGFRWPRRASSRSPRPAVLLGLAAREQEGALGAERFLDLVAHRLERSHPRVLVLLDLDDVEPEGVSTISLTVPGERANAASSKAGVMRRAGRGRGRHPWWPTRRRPSSSSRARRSPPLPYPRQEVVGLLPRGGLCCVVGGRLELHEDVARADLLGSVKCSSLFSS